MHGQYLQDGRAAAVQRAAWGSLTESQREETRSSATHSLWLASTTFPREEGLPVLCELSLPPAGTSHHLWLAQFVPWFSVGLFTKDQGDYIFKIVGRSPILHLISPPDNYWNTHTLNCAPVKTNQCCCPNRASHSKILNACSCVSNSLILQSILKQYF